MRYDEKNGYQQQGYACDLEYNKVIHIGNQYETGFSPEVGMF